MKYKLHYRLINYLLLLSFVSVLLGIAIINKSILIILFTTVAVILFVYGSYGCYSKVEKNISRLAEAVKNRDFTFIINNSSTIQGISNSLNEIIDVLKTEKFNLEEKEKYYGYIINNIPMSIIVLTEKFEIISCNETTLSMFNLEILSNLSQLSRYNGLDEILRNIDHSESRYLFVKINECEMNLLVRANNVNISNVIYKVITIGDIRQEINRNELDSWIKLTRVLTHEIMNGIAPINFMCNAIISENKDISPAVLSGINVISNISNRMMKMVDAYRQFSLLPTPNPKPIYVAKIISDIRLLLSEELSGVKVNVDVSPDDLLIYADESLIRQVIINILKNAIQSMNFNSLTTPEIKIQSFIDSKERIYINMFNNGEEITDDVEDNMFVPFFTTKNEGSGIGLSVSRKIMMLSDGSLEYEHRAGEKYTTCFKLIFN
ncbi:MAG: ATP-binding protein [Muribaculaceae bacterium]|nr:ATP-binding protein [Muribaculaceae bacterium]